MALTIRMRIDDHDEHSYYYATGDGTEIELIPLVVDENGVFVPDEGKAYNKVTVNVPETELETLIVDANGTYNAPDGKAYNVVTVNVQQIINLQNKSASYTSNGNYTIQADSVYDGLGTVSVAVSVPNTYSVGDEGKVVSNGALVAQTAHADVTPSTSDQTINTTLNNSIKVKGDADLVAGNIKKNVEIFGVTGTYEGGGGNSNTDVVYFTPDNSGALQMVEIRANETPQAIYVFSATPDMLMFNGADVISNFACCVNSTYDGVAYTYDSVVESSNYGQITTDNNTMLVLDGWLPSTLPQGAGYDAFGIDSGYLYGYFLDVNDTTGFGLNGDYVVVVVYGVEPPVE